MRRIWLLVLAVLVLAVAIGGFGTLAYFTDTAANQNNNFMAGTLDISSNRDQGDSIDGPMFYTNEDEGMTYDGQMPPIGPPDGPGETGFWQPGASHERVLQIENTGSLDGVLTSVRATLSTGSSHLADKLQVEIFTLDDAGNENIVSSGTLGEFINVDRTLTNGPVEAYVGDIINLHFRVTLPTDADNTYQNESLVASFTVNAEQM